MQFWFELERVLVQLQFVVNPFCHSVLKYVSLWLFGNVGLLQPSLYCLSQNYSSI